jgi:dipeptidyl aminopeptidase/acylaminoacyl peptidase
VAATGSHVDIREYLEVRTATPSNFSPDGETVLIQSNLPGTSQLYTVPRAGGVLRQITDFDEPVAGVYLPTSDEIVLSMSAEGNERTQLFLVADDGSGLHPLVRDPDHIHRVGGVTRDGELLAYASNARNDVDFDVYVMPLAGGAARTVFDRGGLAQPRGFSPDGRWLTVSRLTERSGDNDTFLVDVAEGNAVEIAAHEDEAYVGAPAWLADGSAFYFPTDVGRDRIGIARFDVASGSWRYVIEREWDLGCIMNWPATTLLVTTTEDGYTDAELLDPQTLMPRGRVPQPGRGVSDYAFSRDGQFLAYSFRSPVEPGDAWCYDCATGETTRLTQSPRGVDTESLVEPFVVRVTSFDGEQVPMFVYRPHRNARDRAPVVVYLHGGPESQYVPSFDPLIQFLVANGYAVVAPNVRGSTGYGKRFEHLDDRQRRLDAVADLECVHDWIRAQPELDESRAALMGASYGGYLVLAGLAFQPERWAAGVDIVGISSLTTFLENTAEWRRSVREAEYGSLEHDREFLDHASPLYRAERIRAPLFIIHGANDPRVPVEEAQQVHRIVVDNGVRAELAVYPDEGHGLAKLKNRIDAYPKVAAFLDEVLDVT